MKTRERIQGRIIALQRILERGYVEVRMFSKQYKVPLTVRKKNLLNTEIESLQKQGMQYLYISSAPTKYGKFATAFTESFPTAGKPYISKYRQKKKAEKNPNHIPKCDISDEAFAITE